MMATSLVQAVRKNLECRVCWRICKDPKILTCSHTFCKDCLETLLESHWRKDVLLCPTCRGGTWVPGGDVDGLQSNVTVRSLVEAVETHGHSNCNQEDESLQRKWNICPKHPNYDEIICLITSQISDGLQLGQLIRQKESKWVLRALLPVEDKVYGMAISPNNEMTVVYFLGGIVIYSSQGIKQGTVLKNVFVWALDFMPDTGYVVRESRNRISLYTDRSEKLDVTFETMDVASGTSGGLTVGKDGLIFVGYNVVDKIQVFKRKGGKAIREITCHGFNPNQIFAMTSCQAIVVKSSCNTVQLINDVSGAIIHSISKIGEEAYPAVCQDNSVIIAWVKYGEGLLSIVQYKQEPKKCIKNILTDFKIITPYNFCYLQEFKTGEIAFCTRDRLYIFHETWE